MNWLQLLPIIMNIVLKLIPVAEKAFSDKPKSGPEKKAMVVETARTVVGALGAHSTGGQKETWTILKDPVNIVIDETCNHLFNKENHDAECDESIKDGKE